MKGRNPFIPKAPHHLYIGLFVLFLSWTMWDYDYYHPLCEVLAVVGLFITVDDVIEHTITSSTPLRLLFDKVVVPLLRKIRLMS